jgi:hypothetical protein
MSAKHTIDWTDWQSVARHFAIPLIAGAVIAALNAALETMENGALDLALAWDAMKNALSVSVVAVALRLVQCWQTDI